MTKHWRTGVEHIADQLEEVARFSGDLQDQNDPIASAIKQELMARAWTLKQYARAGSPSEGV